MHIIGLTSRENMGHEEKFNAFMGQKSIGSIQSLVIEYGNIKRSIEQKMLCYYAPSTLITVSCSH
jgi:hypothetical protein